MQVRNVGALALSWLAASWFPLAATAAERPNEPADSIYRGGEIVTVDDQQPTAQAVAVRDGLIVAVGDEDTVLKLREPKTRLIALGGHTLVPGFIDAHGHIFHSGVQALAANLLAPPDGEVRDIASLQARRHASSTGSLVSAMTTPSFGSSVTPAARISTPFRRRCRFWWCTSRATWRRSTARRWRSPASQPPARIPRMA